MTTHTADCADCDFRINKVPARDHEEGATRPLYLYKGSYPATITSDRGVTWHPDNLEGSKEQLAAWGTESVITGRIPEVKACMIYKWCMRCDYTYWMYNLLYEWYVWILRMSTFKVFVLPAYSYDVHQMQLWKINRPRKVSFFLCPFPNENLKKSMFPHEIA